MTIPLAPERVAEVSRRLRARADGVVAELWFMPESQTGYPTLGIGGAAGTFGGRTGPLGALRGASAAALLVPLNPAFTGPAVDEAWAATTPDELLALRERTATAYLAEIIGPEPDGLARAADLARRAADVGPVEGHPLAAAHRTRGWSGEPLVDVWRACERIRERRHESHRNVWTAAGLDACEICVLTDLWRGPLISSVSSSWSQPDQDEARERLRIRGLVAGDEISDDGRAVRDEIELATDRQETEVVAALGDDADELLALLAPWSTAAVAWASASWAGDDVEGSAMKVPMTVLDHIERAELVYGDRVAVVDEPDQPAASWGSLTYRDMATRARAQAAALDALGVAHGERVAIVSHNSARLLTSFFGVSAYGRIVVPINFRLSAEEVAYIVDHCGASVLLVDPELEPALAGIEAKHRFVIGAESDEALYHHGIEPYPWAERSEDATASINYTSGTTARPKGVQITHRNAWLNAATFGWHLGINDRDVYLHTLPMFHCNGWGVPYMVTGMGGRHVVLRKVDGHEILRRVEAHGVTVMCGAPAVAAAILDCASEWEGPIPGAGRVRIVLAGAPPPTRTIERIETELGWEFVQIYGLTETSPLLTFNRGREEYDDLPPRERAERLARAGAPALGCRLQISDHGEVLARSNVVLEGYWEQPEATSEAIVDGWFHTGDGGTLNEEHHLTISDRKKDVIISGGENVSSIEVEDALFRHPAVAEVAVIGVPDEKWGETVKALVVLVPGSEVDERGLIDHCREHLADYKCPTSVEFRDELARTATGKLQKFRLRAPYWEGLDRQVN